MSGEAREDARKALRSFERVTCLLPRGEPGLFGRHCLVTGNGGLGLAVLLSCAGAHVVVVGDTSPGECLEALLRALLLRLRAEGRWLDPDPILAALSQGEFQPTQLALRGAQDLDQSYDLAVGVVGVGVRGEQLQGMSDAIARGLRPGGLAVILAEDPEQAERGRTALAQAGLAQPRCAGAPPAALAEGLLGGLPTEFPSELLDEQILAHSRARYALIAGLARGKRVLDVGCGSGMGTRRLASAGAASLVGVEGSLPALEIARRTPFVPGVSVEWREVDLEEGLGELPSQAFEFVVCLEVLEHVRDQPRMIAELRRVLSPEGVLALSVPHRPFEERWRALGVINPYHLHVPDLVQLRAYLVGFRSQHLFVQSDLAASVLRPLNGDLPGPLPVHIPGPGRLADDGTISVLAIAGPADLDLGCLSPAGWAHVDHQATVLGLTAECQRLRRELEQSRASAARAKWIALGYPSGNDETWLQRVLGHARWVGSDLVRRLRRPT